MELTVLVAYNQSVLDKDEAQSLLCNKRAQGASIHFQSERSSLYHSTSIVDLVQDHNVDTNCYVFGLRLFRIC